MFSMKARKIHFFHGCLLSLQNSAYLNLQDSHKERRGEEDGGRVGAKEQVYVVGVGKVADLILNLLCEIPPGQTGHTTPTPSWKYGSYTHSKNQDLRT